MKTRTLLYRFLSIVTLLALLLPLSPTLSSMARREPSTAPMTILPNCAEFDGPTPGEQAKVKATVQVTSDDPLLPLDGYDEFVYLPLTLNNYPSMLTIPAGEFQMGCDDSNPNEDCDSGEQPLHTVYLDVYAIDKYEVTNAQYAEFLNVMGNQEEEGDTWLHAEDWRVRIHQNGGVWQVDAGYEDDPVIEVTWYGARAYCEWQGKRLPTEAEWEKAARGSSDTRMYPWGNESPDCSRLNYSYYSGNPCRYCVGDTTPVGSYPSGASPYGALDMAGNVLEWVNDWYDGHYYDVSPYSNPPGPAIGGYKVLRGGGWINPSYYVRVAHRHPSIPGSTWGCLPIGFRCAGVGPGQ